MKNFYISLLIGAVLVFGINRYQTYIEHKSQYIIDNAEKTYIEEDWNSFKYLLYAFNDHEKVEEIDNEYIGMKNTNDEDLKNLHLVYFKKKLKDLIDASKVKIVNIL